LWPQAKALGTAQGEGRDGCVLSVEKNRDPAFAPARSGEARVFKIRCVKPPLVRPGERKQERAGRDR
jgi:hypothetical protein